MRRSLAACFVALVVGVGISGCSDTAENPVAPSASSAAANDAAVTAPVLSGIDLPGAVDDANATLKGDPMPVVFPTEGRVHDQKTVQIRVTNVVLRFSSIAPSLQIELWEVSGTPPTAKLLASATLAPDPSGITSFTPAVELKGLTEYKVRARGVFEGAHTAWSPVVTFTTIAFIEIKPPVPAYPVGGETATEIRPPLFLTNGALVGNPPNVIYQFQVDTNQAFPNPIRTDATRVGGPEAGGRTIGYLSDDLEEKTTYYWRARGVSGSTIIGEWSVIAVFVTPEKPSFGLDEIDPNAVIYLHRNIANWPITSMVTGLSVSSGEICVFHTGAGTFPTSPFGSPGEEIAIEGNVWVFAMINGQWYGATWDWLRPGQECKAEGPSSLGPEQIRVPPMDGSWRPQSGDTLCFAISTRARDEVEAGQERTNIACTVI